MKIAIDFDGTVVEHRYPQIGKERPFACEVLKQLNADGHKLILWTVRSGELLEEALAWCHERGVDFYAVNSNYPVNSLFADGKGASPKVEADIYIDDRNLGGIPDWDEIYEQIVKKRMSKKKRKKRSWFGKLFHR